MATDAKKKHTYVKVKEISLQTLIENSKGNATSGRKTKNTSNAVWGQTVLYINSHKALETFTVHEDIKVIAEEVRQVFKDAFIEDRIELYGEITEETEGRNARTGSLVPILDKNGDPKWSSWEETKLPISYCGDIAQAIFSDITESLVKSATEVLSRGDTLALAKIPETPLQTIHRSCEMIVLKAEALKVDDYTTAIENLEATLKTIEDAHEQLLKTVA